MSWQQWTNVGNIRGPTGPDGPTGPSGEPGVVEVYQQRAEPDTTNLGAIWIDPDGEPPEAIPGAVRIRTRDGWQDLVTWRPRIEVIDGGAPQDWWPITLDGGAP